MQSNYTEWRTAHSCSNSISRLCATLYIGVAGKVVIQTQPPQFDHADGGCKLLVSKQYQSTVSHSVYCGCRKGDHSDQPSSLRPCRWRQQISPRRRYHRTALHGGTKPKQCTVHSSSFCWSLSPVRETTADASDPHQ